jgi:exonuclease III
MKTFSLLTWNICKKDLYDLVADLSRETNPDIIVLLESKLSAKDLLLRLNHTTVEYEHSADRVSNESGIMILSKHGMRLGPLMDGDFRFNMKAVKLDQPNEIIIAAVHLPSQQYFGVADLQAEATEIMREITLMEKTRGHRNTVVVASEPGALVSGLVQ